MAIYLGNLSAKEMGNRLGIEICEGDLQELESFRCKKADVAYGQWHCFDMPFTVVAGGMRAAQLVYDILQKYKNEITYEGDFQISLGIDDRGDGIVRNNEEDNNE